MDYLQPYNSKEIQIYRANVVQRSQGDGEETSSLPDKSLTRTALCDEKYINSLSKGNIEITDAKKTTKLLSQKSLPRVTAVAQKLSRVSLFTVPDPLILSSPPPDFEKKDKILLLPTEAFTDIKRYPSSSIKKKEPKFVPYEPYKGCVKPMIGKSEKKMKIKEVVAVDTQPKLENKHLRDASRKSEKGVRSSSDSSDKLLTMVKDFENERTKWELDNNDLKLENEDLQNQLMQTKKEMTLLQQQLLTQSQVNNELKKLLVASVGEDVQGRVQCLTEDKARMATMIRKYSEKVDRDYEEKEKMSIQCDVWRSKFLASSLLIDELARWKGTLFQRLHEAMEALKVLLGERDVAHHHLVHAYKHIYQIQEGFDPLHAESSGVGLVDSCDIVSLSVSSANISENIRNRLLGSLGRAVGCSNTELPNETRTPGEKMALQILEEDIDPTGSLISYAQSPGRGALLSRYHPNTRYEHVTVNCCGHCSGEIKVV